MAKKTSASGSSKKPADKKEAKGAAEPVKASSQPRAAGGRFGSKPKADAEPEYKLKTPASKEKAKAVSGVVDGLKQKASTPAFETPAPKTQPVSQGNVYPKPFSLSDARDMHATGLPNLIELALSQYTYLEIFPPLDPWSLLPAITGWVINHETGEVEKYTGPSTPSEANKVVWDSQEEAIAAKYLPQLRRFYREAVGDYTPDWTSSGGVRKVLKKSKRPIHRKDKWVVLFIGNELTVKGMFENNRAFVFPNEGDAIDFKDKYKDLLILAKPFV